MTSALGHCATSPGNRANCYAELAVSSLSVAVTIVSTCFAYPGRDGQAELAWTAWSNTKTRKRSPISVPTSTALSKSTSWWWCWRDWQLIILRDNTARRMIVRAVRLSWGRTTDGQTTLRWCNEGCRLILTVVCACPLQLRVRVGVDATLCLTYRQTDRRHGRTYRPPRCGVVPPNTNCCVQDVVSSSVLVRHSWGFVWVLMRRLYVALMVR